MPLSQPSVAEPATGAPMPDRTRSSGPGTWWAAAPSLAIGLVWVLVASWFAVGEHVTHNSTSRDIGVYLQILWNTPHGRPFWTTVLESNRLHVAEHVALLLPALGPVFAAVPDVRWLLVVQQVVVALAAVPVYLLARRRLGGVWLPTLLVAGYFAMPTVAEVASDSFYPVTWSALPLGFAAYFLLTDRWRAGTALALLALPIEEETGLIVVGLGLYVLLQHGARRLGVALTLTGALWVILIAFVVMPRFHDSSTVPSGAGNRTVGHFDQLRMEPVATISTLLTERVPVAARWLLAPTGGVALLAPHILLIDLPDWAILVIADKEQRFRRHWAAPTLPIIWLATVVGLARLRRPPLRALGVAALVVGSTWTYLLDSNLPGGGDYDPSDVVWTDRSEQMAYLVRHVPPDATVAASRRVLGDLADRAELYVFPPSYLGKLWPPERRPQVYVLDLSNDGTREALLGRQSPLRTTRAPYTIWLVGPDGMLLTERPPAPTRAADGESAGIRLVGLDAPGEGNSLDLALHWTAPRRPDRALTRVVRALDANGATLWEQRGTALDELLPTSEWPAGQIVLDRIHVPSSGSAPARLLAGWAPGTEAPELIEVPLP